MGRRTARFMAMLCTAGFLCGTQIVSVYAEEGFSYEDVSNLTFYFSSGVGAWGTELSIHEDGSFEGSFHDTDMGSTGEGYPHGTVYMSNFSGQLGDPEKVNEYTYSASILDMELEKEDGTSEIIDNIRYVYSEPYGLEGTDYVLFYLPGAPLSELPQEFLSWVRYADLNVEEDTELSFVGKSGKIYTINITVVKYSNPVSKFKINSRKRTPQPFTLRPSPLAKTAVPAHGLRLPPPYRVLFVRASAHP